MKERGRERDRERESERGVMDEREHANKCLLDEIPKRI